MLKRTLTGLGLLLIVVGAAAFDLSRPSEPGWATSIIIAILSLGALEELLVLGVARSGRRKVARITGVMWLTVLAAAALADSSGWKTVGDLLVAASLVACLFLAVQMRHRPGPVVHHLAGSMWFQVPYVGGVACMVLLLLAGYVHYAVGVALVAKACDMGAYFTGRFLGRHPLLKRISPNKTVEGAIGGLVAAAVAAPLLLGDVAAAEGVHIAGGWAAVPLGLGIGILAMLADLSESLLKRARHAKDSGRIFGDSGGFLDLSDSLLLVGPFAVAYTAVLV